MRGGRKQTPVVVDGVMYCHPCLVDKSAHGTPRPASLYGNSTRRFPGERASQRLLRCRQPRRSRRGITVCRRTRRPLIALDKKTARNSGRPRPSTHRNPIRHRRAAVVKEWADRQWRRRIGVRGYVTAYDADTASYAGASTPTQSDQAKGRRRVRRHFREQGQRDMVRQGRVADLGRRTAPCGTPSSMTGSRPDLSRCRQRQSVEPWHALERRRHNWSSPRSSHRCVDRRV